MKKLKVLMLTATMSVLTCFSALAGEWKLDNAGWWYENENSTYENSGWSWINERWYYFTPEGYCLMNTTTPDEYLVDESGAWTLDGVVQTKGSDVAVISSTLRFNPPKGYSLNKKTEKKTYSGSGVNIVLDTITLGADITGLDPEGATPCQFKSGEWMRYSSDNGRTIKYMRIIGSTLHKVEFHGSVDTATTDALMDDCVQ